MARIEFYVGTGRGSLIAATEDGAVPRATEYVNIKNVTYTVQRVTWAVDDTHPDPYRGKLRANIELEVAP